MQHKDHAKSAEWEQNVGFSREQTMLLIILKLQNVTEQTFLNIQFSISQSKTDHH